MTWTPSSKIDETWDDDRELTFVDGIWDSTRYWNVNDIWRNDPLWAGATENDPLWANTAGNDALWTGVAGTAETWSEA